MEQQEKDEEIIGTEPVPTPLETTRKTIFTNIKAIPTPRSLTRLFAAEWDAIVGLFAALLALLIHWLHIGAEDLLLQIAVGLIALLFLRSLRQERRTKQAFTQVRRSLGLLRSIRDKLAQQESITNDIHSAANVRLALLQNIEAKQVTQQHLKTHNLCFQIEQIEQSLANTLINTKWEETRENIENLAQGRIIVRNRADIFTYKEKGLNLLGKGEQFRSTVIPMDLDPPAAYEDDHFEGYQERMFKLADRSRSEKDSVRRLYIFRDQQQFEEPRHRAHMQLMADHHVEVRYLILSRNVQSENQRDRVAHADYAIFGERFYAQFDTTRRRSVIDTDQNRIAEAIRHFESLWTRAGNQSIQRQETGSFGL